MANESSIPLIIIPTTISQNHFSGHVLLSDDAQFCYVPRADYVVFDTNFLQHETTDEFKRQEIVLFLFAITLMLQNNASQFVKSATRNCAQHIVECMSTHRLVPTQSQHCRFWLAYVAYEIGTTLQETSMPLL